ncbi:helix-turn-helix transcriptional regulator, partial [Streptomyces scabiei]|uniref:helix-turn-helix transcriptional regulator n=1 Tax=Streptomyces scabiei TaxID=1930 RepID=UPI0029A5E18A
AGPAQELVEAARDTATEGEDGAEQGPEGMAWLARAEAEWARVRGGPDVTVWRAAVDAFAFADPYERARCRLRLAEALLVAGEREEAAAEARAVAETADRLGAVTLRAALDALVRRGRLAETSTAGNVPALTARESDVLRLLALGRTNRQIGDELFITGKTASVHVSNILAKLGAASRTEAVAIAYREGLITVG